MRMPHREARKGSIGRHVGQVTMSHVLAALLGIAVASSGACREPGGNGARSEVGFDAKLISPACAELIGPRPASAGPPTCRPAQACSYAAGQAIEVALYVALNKAKRI